MEAIMRVVPRRPPHIRPLGRHSRISRVGILVLLGLVACGVAAMPGGAVVTVSEQSMRWDVGAAGPDGRSIDVLYQPECFMRDVPRALVRESTDSVAIALSATFVRDSEVACPALLPRPQVLRVPLATPLDGRSIRGRAYPPVSSFPLTVPGPRGELLVRIPRLAGLSSWEARRVLRQRRLVARVRYSTGSGRRSQVRGQRPAAGAAVASGSVVRVHVALR